MSEILYITQNGVTDHIGRSQIAPYIIGLGHRGFKIHVLSAEKSGRDALISRYSRDFAAVGVRWTRVPYRSRPSVIGQAWTQLDMRAAARKIARAEGVRVVHCRCFPPALIGWELKRSSDLQFIFDFRDFYADDGLAKWGGAKRAVCLGLKRVEGSLIRASDKIVCLTHKAASMLAGWYLADDPNAMAHFQVIPCCADFTHFDRNRVSAADIARARHATGVRADQFVLLYLGSLGADYLLDRMMALFAQLLKERPNARFVFLSNNGEDLVQAACAAHDIARRRVAFVSADRDDVPNFLAMTDLSVIFIRPDISKAGCSPTKLAELFACGVPVVANSGVGDMDRIIQPGHNASVLVGDMSDQSLHAAVKNVLATSKTIPIRENSREFDLDAGIAKYAAVYTQLLHG